MNLNSDRCAACGHERVFHQIGTGNGVPVDQEYCDDRHAEPCDCRGFIYNYWSGLDLRWALANTFIRLFAAEDEVGPALVWLTEPFSTALTLGYTRLLSANVPSPWE